MIFVHGARGSPFQFAPIAASLRRDVNVGAFLYDDHARLAPAAESLRRELMRLSGNVVLVAYSMGTLLCASVGADDRDGRFREVGAVYVNPLIGGSRYADADPALAILGDLPMLRWLHQVKTGVQRLLFPPFVQDLAPESDFQQAIFGRGSRPASFAGNTTIVFTEEPGREWDISGSRVERFFGRSRGELLARLGTVAPLGAATCVGHAAVLAHEEILLPPIMQALAAQQAASPIVAQGPTVIDRRYAEDSPA